jgi:hypothetical protein
MDNASTALNPPAARNITYVFKRISEHAIRMSVTSSLDNASSFFLTIFGDLTFSLNFLGMMSSSEYSKKFLIVIT